MSLFNPNSIKPLADKIKHLQNLDLKVIPSSCYVTPKLTFIEATAVIKEVDRARIVFTLPNLYLVATRNNGNIIYPDRGTPIRLSIPYYFSNKDNTKLNRYINIQAGIYTPSVISYVVIDYKVETNIGLASLIRIPPKILLQEPSGSLYEYDLEDIGDKLTPHIKDAYIVL